MLVSDFMVNYMLKNTQRYFCGMHGMSKEDVKKKKGQILYIGGRGNQLLPLPNCLILCTSLMDSVVI